MASDNALMRLPTAEDRRTVLQQVSEAAEAGLLPKGVDGKAGFIIVMAGRELGLNTFEALRSLYSFQGRVGMYYTFMLSRLNESGKGYLKWVKHEASGAACEVYRFIGTTPVLLDTVTFTAEDAKRAGSMGKDTYQKYPADMLVARCASRAMRWYFPDVLQGILYTPEDLHSIPERELGPRVVSVSEDGDVVIEAVDAEGPLEAAVAVDAEPKPLMPVRVPPAKVVEAVEAHGATEEDVAGMAALAWAKIGVEKTGLPEGTSAFETPEQQDEWERRFWKAGNRWAKDNPQAVEAEAVE